ncbi:MAG: hypothetical protein PHE55_07465 [Methylococcaceae bacterium]|nr:hypothetical protein [Methylococcaceae bacterium]
MNDETFSAQEAMCLLGKEVQSSRELEDLPMGTPGRIIQIRLGSRTGIRVAVQWRSAMAPGQDEFTKSEFERYLAIAE